MDLTYIITAMWKEEQNNSTIEISKEYIPSPEDS